MGTDRQAGRQTLMGTLVNLDQRPIPTETPSPLSSFWEFLPHSEREGFEQVSRGLGSSALPGLFLPSVRSAGHCRPAMFYTLGMQLCRKTGLVGLTVCLGRQLVSKQSHVGM